MKILSAVKKRYAKVWKFSATFLLTSISLNASAELLYFNDFDSPEMLAPGISTSGFDNGTLEPAYSGFGNWSGNFLANRSTGNPALMSTLSLSNIGVHSHISISFILGFLDSWDGPNNATYAPDNLDFYIDGVLRATVYARRTTSTEGDYYAGGVELFEDVYANNNSNSANDTDTLVDMATAPFLTFAHSSSTLTFGIQASGTGWQGGFDEAWGIDSLSISSHTIDPAPVPETMPITLLSLGLLGMGLQLSSRKVCLRSSA